MDVILMMSDVKLVLSNGSLLWLTIRNALSNQLCVCVCISVQCILKCTKTNNSIITRFVVYKFKFVKLVPLIQHLINREGQVPYF